MRVVQMPLASLNEYAGNAKVHDEANVEAIRASIRRFGMCDPIGVWTTPDGAVEIVEGHGRKMALEAEGYEVADVIFLDHLTDDERRAYALAHNQTTLMSDFDLDILEAELDLLADFDMGDFGFAESEAPSFIQDLLESEFSANSTNAREDIFTLTLVFDRKDMDVVKAYVKDKGREGIAAEVAEGARAWLG